MENIDLISINEFNFETKETNSLKDNLILSSELVYNQSFFKHPSRLNAIAAIFCANGTAEIQINLKKYKLKSGDLVLNIPENIIQITNMENFTIYPILISYEFFQNIKVEHKILMEVYMMAKNNPTISLGYPDIRLLEKYHNLLEAILQSSDENKEEMVFGILESFLIKVHSILAGAEKSKNDQQRVPSRSEIVFEQFIRELTIHHTKEHSLLFYADKLGYTPNYLSARIKEYSGKTGATWIEEFVILEAKTLLKHSQLNIQEIAYKLNFPTQTFFGKYFKRITGMSPKQYKML